MDDSGADRLTRPDDVITVLYIYSDEHLRDQFLSVAESAENSLSVETLAATRVTASHVQQGAFDVVVIGVTDPGDGLVTGPEPTILYTDDDPSDVAPDILSAVDSVVEKSAGGSHQFLVEKIRGLVGSQTGTGETGTQTLSKLSADIDDSIGLFLLDSDGSIRWSNVPFESFFPGATGESVARADDFDARLAALSGDQSETSCDTVDADRLRFVEVSGNDTCEQFFHTTYPVEPVEAGERIEVFVPVTKMLATYERQELFERLVENAQDGLFVLDADGRIDFCNRSFAEMVGYGRDELVGEHASHVMAAGELERGHEVIGSLLDSGETSTVTDLTFVTSDGQQLDVSINFSLRYDDSETYTGLMGVARDVTERKQRERELEEYRKLVESAGDPMYVLDADGTIAIANRAMEEFVGQDRETVVGENVRTIISDETLEQGKRAIRQVLADDDLSATSFETWLETVDGEERLFEVTVSAITEDGEFMGSVAMFRDITAHHRYQETLDLRKQVFARSLRHNIRNETSVIRSYASILAEELDGEHAAMAEDILEASRSLARTSEKVSQFDWLVEQNPNLVTHDLPQLVARCLEEVRDIEPEASISVDIPTGTRVRAIPDLDVAVRNLLENALQHGSEQGPPTVRIETTVSGGEVILAVEDDGPGIPGSEINVVDSGEETALNHASGLGLWLVNRVVSQSGGELSFRTNDGTRAEVTLQLADDDA